MENNQATLFRDNKVVEESWELFTENLDGIEKASHALVSLDLWDKNLIRERSVGVLLKTSDDVLKLPPEVLDSPVIAIQIDNFNDGRFFSQAKLLRQRLSYSGEIRANGDVLLDQVQAMVRCGINSFELNDLDNDIERYFSTFSESYQKA